MNELDGDGWLKDLAKERGQQVASFTFDELLAQARLVAEGQKVPLGEVRLTAGSPFQIHT